jgi:hypothetical protein
LQDILEAEVDYILIIKEYEVYEDNDIQKNKRRQVLYKKDALDI